MNRLLRSFTIIIFICLIFWQGLISPASAQSLGTWERVSDMIAPHALPQGVLLHNGKALIIGNSLLSGESTAELYDPETDKWEQTSPLAGTRQADTATILKNGNVLVAGMGLSQDGSELISSEIYYPDKNIWSKAAQMVTPRLIHTALLLDNGQVIVAGGLDQSFTPTNSVEVYNPVSNNWSNSAPMHDARIFHTMTKLNNGSILVTGGQNESFEFLKSAEIYDPATNTWKKIDDIDIPRYAHSASILTDGKVLITGGTDFEDTYANAEIYDPATNTWKNAKNMNIKKAFHQSILISGGEVMVIGGSNENNPGDSRTTNTVELYDPKTDEWKLIPPMNNRRGSQVTLLLKNGDILSTGGFDDNFNWIKSAEIFRGSGAPVPFLDLPWDYKKQGKNFEEVILNINSYFDHAYPSLGGGIIEPLEYRGHIVTFDGETYPSGDAGRWYSRHDGYDYGTIAGVKSGDPVLPTAPGIASYRYDNAGGNAIFIDHGNGYQTRYYHLQNTGLITKTPGVNVPVDRNTPIGKVGSTGNNTSGPHIHIGIFQDKNNDGNFDDNIPDGATDPFGWQSTEPDPWESYTFLQNGIQRTGNKSYYLWKKRIPKLREDLSSNGGVYNVGRFEIIVPPDSTFDKLTLESKLDPGANISKSIISIGPTLEVILKDPFGSLITILTKPMFIGIDFSEADLSRFKPGTIFIYSSTDRKTWKKEKSFIDFLNNKATAEVDHLTYFALMGERVDTEPATTEHTLSGNMGDDNWYRSDVQFSLTSIDNDGGLGVEIVLYKIEGEDWQEYISPIQFSNEGKYNIEYYSQDKDGNLEDVKSIEFHIDKTAPEAKVYFDQDNEELIFEGIDNSEDVKIDSVDLNKNNERIILTDKAGNKLSLENIEKMKGKRQKLNILSLTYNDLIYELDKNKFLINYKTSADGDIEKFDQLFQIKNEDKISLKYNPKKNNTLIQENKEKNEYDGIKILQLLTENGNLKYIY